MKTMKNIQENAYRVTISCNDASKSFVAKLTNEQVEKIEEDALTSYDLIFTKMADISNCGSYLDLRIWLKKTKLYTVRYKLTSVSTEVVELPEGVVFKDGYLEVSVVSGFKEHDHASALREVKLMKWVLEKFPTSEYYCSRNRFTLNMSSEMTLSEDKVTGHTITITPSGEQYIEITTRTFLKEEVEL